jgi:hypothetical protein
MHRLEIKSVTCLLESWIGFYEALLQGRISNQISKPRSILEQLGEGYKEVEVA